MYFLDPLDSIDLNWYYLNFCRDWGNPSWKDALILSLFSWEPLIQGQSKRIGSNWRFHTQICILRTQVWCVSRRKKKSNTFVQLLQTHGLSPARLLCPWDFSGKNTGVGCHFLLQGIFPTQESNWGLLHCRWFLYQLRHKGNPCKRYLTSVLCRPHLF